ncbi:MAG: hypothetical protein ACI94O_001459 [Octadecabacter sp.]|jgi:hypothetical protein
MSVSALIEATASRQTKIEVSAHKNLVETISSENKILKEDSDNQVQDSSSNNGNVKKRQSNANVSEAEEMPDANNATTDVATESYPTQTQSCMVRIKRNSNTTLQDCQINAQVKVTQPDTEPNLGLLDGADDLNEYLEYSHFTDIEILNFDDEDFAKKLAAIKGDFEDSSATKTPISRMQDEGATGTSRNTNNFFVSVANTKQDKISTNSTPEDGFNAGEPQIDDTALDSLMSETDMHMLEPEGSRRRDAISQLKAAVAAKQAAHKMDQSDNDNQEVENAFRNYLSVAVRPEVTVSTTNTDTTVHSNTHTKRPCPTPLKLVTTQRIDMEASAKHAIIYRLWFHTK